MKWITKSYYIDLETGCQIITVSEPKRAKEMIELEYEIIKKRKNTYYDRKRRYGIIEYSIECRKRTRIQGNLF